MAKDNETVIETINIEEITAHASKKGKKFWKAKTTDDEYYTVWKEDVKDRLSRGTNSVVVEINDTGDMVFRNVVGIAPGMEVEDSSGSFLDEMDGRRSAHVAKNTTRPDATPVASPLTYSNLTPAAQARAVGIQVAARLVAGGIAKASELLPAAERATTYILNGVEQKKSTSELDPAQFMEN